MSLSDQKDYLERCLEIDKDKELHEIDDLNIARAIYRFMYREDGTLNHKNLWSGSTAWKLDHLDRYRKRGEKLT